MNPVSAAFAGLIVLGGFLVGGVAGYGSTLLALPAMALLVGDVRTCVLVLAVVGMVQSIYLLWHTSKSVNRRELQRIGIVAGLGMPLGMLGVDLLPQRPLLLVLGSLAIVSAVVRWLVEPQAHLVTRSRPLLDGLLFIAGVVHGAFACGGVTLVTYGQFVFTERDAFRGTLSLVWILLNSVLIATSFWRGMWTSQALPLMAMVVPAGVVAAVIGQRLAVRINSHRFARFVSGLLALVGLLTIWRGLG